MASDVIVIGGGMAGLSAARELARAGAAVTLVEARARLGGRTFTARVSGSAEPVELGAEFVHGRPRELFELIEAAGLSRERLEAAHVQKGVSGFVPADDVWQEIGRVSGTLDLKQRDVSAAEFLTSGTLGAGAAQRYAAFLEGFHAGELERLSMRSIVRQTNDDDEEQGRIREGYAALAEFLARDAAAHGARIERGTRVTHVAVRPDGVSVLSVAREWKARAAVCAVPLSILKARARDGGISIDPAPESLRRGLAAVEMGHALRVVLRLREPLGCLAGLPRCAFVHGVAAEFPTFWLGPDSEHPRVTAWCGGPRAAALEERDEGWIVEAAVRSLAAAAGVSRQVVEEALLGAHVHPFGSDDLSRGAYPYGLAGGEPDGAFEPILERLHFAGDYCDPDELGTVGVAVRSGVRAARRIVAAGIREPPSP